MQDGEPVAGRAFYMKRQIFASRRAIEAPRRPKTNCRDMINRGVRRGRRRGAWDVSRGATNGARRGPPVSKNLGKARS